jgi:MYXO-CTERM domain-containing protein
VFAGPDYEVGDKTKARASRQFAALRHAADEARSIVTTLTGATTLEGAAATEASLKALHAPKILHVSTHGFFDRDDEALHAAPDEKPLHIENPLLRSGLAFAGANRGGVGKEDGLLTALEASQLDLWGTKLVVLSACETGMGQAKNGDGVYGLRRAFTMAGAETVVMSLWQVDARATTDLMKAYYQGLSAGGGRAEALREVQRAMLSSADRAHPHYWASFIVSGDDRSMEGRPVEPSFARVNPGARGCACETAGAAGGGDERWCFLALALGAGVAMRRRYGERSGSGL